MTVLAILQYPDPRLRQACQRIAEITPAHHALAQDMLDTMYAAKGRGLAAPQIGELLSLFVMDVAWKDGPPIPKVFYNPEILPSPIAVETTVRAESCLSIPDRSVHIARPAFVRMTWQDQAGRDCIGDFDGFAATCVQHEYDHLKGILCIDYPQDVPQTTGKP